VEPLTPSELIDDITLITQRDKDYFNGPSHANGRPQRRSPSPRDRLPFPSYTSLPFPVSGYSNGNEDENDSPVDILPEHLAQQLDPKTGLVKGRTSTMVMYLLAKAKYRYALERHDALIDELKETKQELKRARDDKERVLNDVLRTCFGPQAEQFVAPIPIPGMSTGVNTYPSTTSSRDLGYSVSAPPVPPYINGHGR